MRLRHALSGALYETGEDGLVRVELGDKSGLFHVDGRWHSGDLRDADPHLLLWVGGPQLGARGEAPAKDPEGRGQSAPPAPPATSSSSTPTRSRCPRCCVWSRSRSSRSCARRSSATCRAPSTTSKSSAPGAGPGSWPGARRRSP